MDAYLQLWQAACRMLNRRVYVGAYGRYFFFYVVRTKFSLARYQHPPPKTRPSIVARSLSLRFRRQTRSSQETKKLLFRWAIVRRRKDKPLQNWKGQNHSKRNRVKKKKNKLYVSSFTAIQERPRFIQQNAFGRPLLLATLDCSELFQSSSAFYYSYFFPV